MPICFVTVVATNLPVNVELQPNSSSPFGHCFFPSHRVARDTHLPLSAHLNDSFGHSTVARVPRFNVHSSSDASLQSGRPSQTKYQLIQWPLERHWNVSAGHPVDSA